MSVIWKWIGIILGIFMALWIIWYLTGGPRRDMEVKPYVRYDYDEMNIYPSDRNLEEGAREMIDLSPEKQIIKSVKVESEKTNSGE